MIVEAAQVVDMSIVELVELLLVPLHQHSFAEIGLAFGQLHIVALVVVRVVVVGTD